MAESIRLSKELCETIRQEGIARRKKAELEATIAKQNASPITKAKEVAKTLPDFVRGIFRDTKK